SPRDHLRRGDGGRPAYPALDLLLGTASPGPRTRRREARRSYRRLAGRAPDVCGLLPRGGHGRAYGAGGIGCAWSRAIGIGRAAGGTLWHLYRPRGNLLRLLRPADYRVVSQIFPLVRASYPGK